MMTVFGMCSVSVHASLDERFKFINSDSSTQVQYVNLEDFHTLPIEEQRKLEPGKDLLSSRYLRVELQKRKMHDQRMIEMENSRLQSSSHVTCSMQISRSLECLCNEVEDENFPRNCCAISGYTAFCCFAVCSIFTQ